MAVALFQWTDDLRVDVERIDQQHRAFYAHFQALHTALEEGIDPGAVGIALNLLAEYAKFHFSEEEKLMLARYPGAQAHRAEHDRFRLDLQELRTRWNRSDRRAVRDLLAFMGEWLGNHILATDRELAAYLPPEAAGRPGSQERTVPTV